MDYKNSNDNQLWERCHKSNDERAYNEIFNRYFPRMRHTVSRYVKDMMKAEELVMDCFFKLWNKREQITIEGDFSNYIFSCIHNTVLSYFRKKLPTMVGIESAESRYEVSRSADSNLLANELSQIYLSSLQKLTSRRREVFLMRRDEDLSYAEIARLTNVSESAVKNSMSAALEGLRVNMKECISVIIFFLFPLL